MARSHFVDWRLPRANDTVPSFFDVLGSLPSLLRLAERATRALGRDGRFESFSTDPDGFVSRSTSESADSFIAGSG
jgi:hypothetical protein